MVNKLHKPLLGQPAIKALRFVVRIRTVSENKHLSPVQRYHQLFNGLGRMQGEYTIQLKDGAVPFVLTTPSTTSLDSTCAAVITLLTRNIIPLRILVIHYTVKLLILFVDTYRLAGITVWFHYECKIYTFFHKNVNFIQKTSKINETKAVNFGLSDITLCHILLH